MSGFESGMIGTGMIEAGVNAQSLAQQAKAQELVRFKQQIDGLKSRLEDGPDKEAQLREACTNFEAVFMGKLWQEMQKTVPKEGYLHSNMEQMYIGMFDQPFSEHLAKNGGIGLADMIYDQLAGKLKSTSQATLPGNAEIRPLAENGKAEIKSLAESFPHPTALNTEEGQGSGAEPSEDELKAVASSGEEVSRSAAPGMADDKRVDQLSQAEIAARMNALAREIAQASEADVQVANVQVADTQGAVTVESRPLENPGEASAQAPFPGVTLAQADLADQAWENASLGAEPEATEASGAESGAGEFLPGPGDFQEVAMSGSDHPEVPEPEAAVAHNDVGEPAEAAAKSGEEGEWVSADSLSAGI